jgi:peptide/nickel transport system substrate-binding protein
MFSQKHYETHGDVYCQQNPVGTGPFVLKSWTRNIGKEFVRNEKYWGGKVKLDGINYTVYNDPLVAQAAMMSEEIDVFSGMPLSGIKPMKDRGFVIASEPLTDHSSVLVFNSQNTNKDDPTGNILVRQAIMHAIDKNALVKAAYRGTAVPQNQFGIGKHFFNKDVVGYDYDVAKAKALLVEAGYPNGFQTQLQAFATGANSDVVQIIQADLAKVGIMAKVDVLTGAAGNQKMTGWGTGLWYHTPSVNVDVAMQMASIFSQGLSGSVLGLATMLHPDDVHAALTRSVSAVTDADSVKAVGEANKLLIDKYAIYMPVAEYSVLYVLNKRVKDSGIGASFYTVATLANAYLDG